MLDVSELLVIALAPLLGAILAGLFGRRIGRAGSHWITILGVAVSFVLSSHVLYELVANDVPAFNRNLYTWFQVGGISAHVGFLVDRLSAMMMVVVTFVSLMVHIYTIGYMADNDGYERFFSYIALFTFSMLMLVMSNNFLQLFFGWEAVGLVSYLLIGFWFKRPTAIFANLKAFLVNRVGDFGFLLGIAGVLFWLGTLDYATAFASRADLAAATISPWGSTTWSAATFVCIALFVGAMGKSAQVPLHVWLPDSMEGPTPISALIHAATMVTAGIFMVARMSPLFELSDTALQFVLFIGATTAFFTGLIGIVQNDIKRVVAYSTLSQLGYMTVALGVSAYSAAVFHLMTHAFFKALLFLAAGSVIIGMHHEQDMRRMGGLRKYMPITWITSLIGTLALVGTPLFSGFYSKDSIIEATHHAAVQGGSWVNQYAYWAVLLGVFVTSFYSFRLLYMTFHGREKWGQSEFSPLDSGDHHPTAAKSHSDPIAPSTVGAAPAATSHDHHEVHQPHESPWVVTVPLILLAIPSIVIGYLTVGPMLFGDFFSDSIYVDSARHGAMAAVGEKFHGSLAFALHGLVTPAFWLALAGFASATFIYLLRPGLSTRFRQRLGPVVRVLENKYGFDDLYQAVFARGSLLLGKGLWKAGDVAVIDNGLVNGPATIIDRSAGVLRYLQSGYLYHYAIAMILGLVGLLAFARWAG